MKKLTILSFVAALMAAFSFTSCNTGGDSYSPPTLDQQQSMINMLGNSQAGGMVYYNENKQNTKEDVLDTIPDIVARINLETNMDKDGKINNYYASVSFKFPVSILSKFVNDDKLAAKIAEMDKVDIKVNLIPYLYSTQTFIANSYDLELGNIVTSEKEYKKVTVKFYNNYCVGGYQTNNSTKKQYFCFYMQPAYIYVDGTQTNLLKANRFNNTDFPPIFQFTTDKQK